MGRAEVLTCLLSSTSTGVPHRRHQDVTTTRSARRSPTTTTTTTTTRAARNKDTDDDEKTSKFDRCDRSVLFFGSFWPDARATGAGVRTTSLLSSGFLGEFGYNAATFASPQRENESSRRLRDDLGVRTMRCPINRREELGRVVDEVAPSVAVFDRFPSEEMFSWVVRERAPDAVRVLDMQDSHALRLWRQAECERGRGGHGLPLPTPPATFPPLQREIAACHRSDLVLVCSPSELELLRDAWGVPESKLCLAPFFYEEPDRSAWKEWDEREHDFVFVGTALHAPNVDAVTWLAREAWPLIREGLEGAQCRVYGAHFDNSGAGSRVRALHDPKSGFLVEGFAEDLGAALGGARVLLAPLRYGAGIKTKILDAWTYGTPVCTTPVGAEGLVCGLGEGGAFGGLWRSSDAAGFARDALALAGDRGAWERAREDGAAVLVEGFTAEANLRRVGMALEEKVAGLGACREQDYAGAAYWHSTLRCQEYFSRWVELKETTGGQ